MKGPGAKMLEFLSLHYGVRVGDRSDAWGTLDLHYSIDSRPVFDMSVQGRFQF